MTVCLAGVNPVAHLLHNLDGFPPPLTHWPRCVFPSFLAYVPVYTRPCMKVYRLQYARPFPLPFGLPSLLTLLLHTAGRDYHVAVLVPGPGLNTGDCTQGSPRIVLKWIGVQQGGCRMDTRSLPVCLSVSVSVSVSLSLSLSVSLPHTLSRYQGTQTDGDTEDRGV